MCGVLQGWQQALSKATSQTKLATCLQGHSLDRVRLRKGVFHFPLSSETHLAMGDYDSRVALNSRVLPWEGIEFWP